MKSNPVANPFPRTHCIRAVLVLLFAACSHFDDVPNTPTMEVVGDTTIARVRGPGTWGDSLSYAEDLRMGKVDGEAEYVFGEISDVVVDSAGTIFVLDRQLKIIRSYDAQGKHLGSFGKKGEGPGELSDPMGMVLLGDGRLVVRDYGNSRMSIYSRDGMALEQWPLASGFATSDPFTSDSANNVYTRVIAEQLAKGKNRFGYMQFDSHGKVVDTVRGPYDNYESAQIVIQNGNAISVYRVPFASGAYWTIDRQGRVVGGVGDRYAIEARAREGKVFRIERDAPRVPVQSAERENREERLRRNAVQMLPGWVWSGPHAPDLKPAILGIRVASDGRLWVQVSQPGVRQPPDPDAAPDPNGLPPLDRWSDAQAFDVFESNGTYLGRLYPPQRFTIEFSRGDYFWGVARDENDVEFVARYRFMRSALK